MNVFVHQFEAMGSACSFQFYAESAWQAEDAAMEGVIEVARLERKYSRFRNDNVTAEINRAAACGNQVAVDPETADLIDFAFACFVKSDGLFDITSGSLRRVWDFKSNRVPSQEEISQLLPFVGMDKVRWTRPKLYFDQDGMEIDLGGIVKEYAADHVANRFKTAQMSNGLTNLGGDLAVFGPHLDGAPWVVGIIDPRNALAPIATAQISSGGLATSGDYENGFVASGRRFGHLLNPKTGWPTTALISVTALGQNCMAAGAAATIAILREEKGPDWLEKSQVPFFSMSTGGAFTNRLPGVYAPELC